MTGSRARAVALLFLAACLAGVARAQTVELGLTGTSTGSAFGGKLMSAVEGMASNQVHTSYREAPNDDLAHAEFNVGTQAAFTSAPLVQGDSFLNVPVAYSTMSIYANIPGVTETINMTTCLLAKIFNGELINWKIPEILEINPKLEALQGDKTVTEILVVRPKLIDDGNGNKLDPADTSLLKDFLRKFLAGNPCEGVTENDDLDYVSELVSTPIALVDDPLGVAKNTPMSITYSTTAQGTASGSSVREVGIQNEAGTYIKASELNAANTISEIKKRLPSPLNPPSGFSGVHAWNMPGEGVYPMTLIHYIQAPSDVSGAPWADGAGALLQAVCKFAVSESGQKFLDGTGLKPLYDADADFRDAVVNTVINDMDISGQTPYELEFEGQYKGNLPLGLSENREDWAISQLVRLNERIAELEHQMELNQNVVLQGSGSSASAAVVWHLMRSFMASASTPVWMYYRAIGSIRGQRESTARNNNFETWNDFAVSDMPLAAADWNRLLQDSIVARRGKPLQVPIGISAMSFFVSIPKDALPDRKMKLTPCDLVKIFTGKVKSWSEFDLAAEDITFFYRSESGTTALVTSYLSEACPDEWSYSEKGLPTIPGFASVENARLADTTMDLANKLTATPWSIGYMDASTGQSSPFLVEVSLQNSAGNFLTSREAKISEAASRVLQSGAWPKDPKGSYAELNLLNQPGEETWPIVHMPFILIHENLMPLGAKGPLLVAFIKYMLEPEIQGGLKAEGVEPIPADVMNFIKTRTLPLFMTDPKFPQWVYEGDSLEYEGSKPFRLSAPDINSDFNVMRLREVKTDLDIIKVIAAEAESLNVRELVNSTANKFQADLSSEKKGLEDKIAEFESLAIAGIIFGIIGAAISILTVARSVAKGLGVSSAKNMRSSSGTGNMFGMGSGSGLRRKPSSLEEGVKPLTAADSEAGSLPNTLP